MSIGMCFNDDVPWGVNLKKNNISNSIIDIFDWCYELGVIMSFGFSKQFDEYFILLNKDKRFKTVYIRREVLNQGINHVYDLVLNALKEIDIVIEEDKKGD